MEHGSFDREMTGGGQSGADSREDQRYALLIRPAKLSSAQGEFLCVLRDVSRGGVSVRLFHRLPACNHFALELQNGDSFEIERCWERDAAAGFRFCQPVDLDRLIREAGRYPKRTLRLAIAFPAEITTLAGRFPAMVSNLSRQGARLHCDAAVLSIDQPFRLAASGFPEVRAKVRWRRDADYGVVFDDTFQLEQFALLAARLQAPGLLARG